MEIMFDDLTPDAQERLLIEAGVSKPEEMNWDTSPVAYVDLDDDIRTLDDDEIEKDMYDFDEDI